MDRIGNFSNLSSMLKDVTYGEINFTPFGAVPSYFLDQRSKEISKIFLKAGAEKIYVPIYHPLGMCRMEKCTVMANALRIADHISGNIL